MKKKKSALPRLRSWDAADHKFAMATIVLFAVLLAGGLAGWLTGGKPSVAAQNPVSSAAPSPRN
jgi:hypothetical protein